MSGFIEAKRTLGFKIESTPGTVETLAAADYAQRAYDIKDDLSIAVKEQKLARGHYSYDPSILGKQSAQISFSVDFHKGASVTAAPEYFKCLRACGLRQFTGANGVWLKTDADYSNVPATIEVCERDEGATPSQLVFQYRGCMGNAQLVVNSVGEPVRIDFTFTGIPHAIIDRPFASIVAPTGFGSTLPLAVLSSTTSLFSRSLTFDKVTIDLGNQVELWTDPNKSQGYSFARIVGRNPSLTIDPDMVLISGNDFWADAKANTTGVFSFQLQNDFTITASKAQLETPYKKGSREGHVTHEMKLKLCGNLGNDELQIAQGLTT